jgi:NADPH:quinone reductase-like Zn-dependent oxidoreductase
LRLLIKEHDVRAYQVRRYRQALELADLAEPEVGPRDVLVQVAAAGLNPLDEKIRAGEFKPLLRYRAPFTLGHDVAGTVVATGRDVTAYAVGDEVWSRPRDGRIGTFAERIAIDQADLSLRPTRISMQEAGALPLVALTAWQALVEIGGLRAGQKVLVHAGAGGVGTVAIQLAKHLGATVATTVSPANAELVRELGADLVIDYRTQRFEDVVHDYDLVLDGVGADHVLRSLTVVRPGGTVVGIAGPPTPAFARSAGLSPALRPVFGLLSRKVRRQARRLGVTFQFLFMRADGGQLAELAALVDAGAIRPVVTRTVGFDELPDALTGVEAGAGPGKTVLTMSR